MIQSPPGGVLDLPAGATVAQYLAKRWGRVTRTVPPAIVSVGTTATQLCKNNPRRFMLAIYNLSVADAFELFNDSVSATQGVRIAALGGSVVYLPDEDGELVTFDHWAVNPSGPLNLMVVEVETI